MWLCLHPDGKAVHLCGVRVWTAECCAGEYISESVWASRKDFEAWRDSQKFQQAHGGEGKVRPAFEQ